MNIPNLPVSPKKLITPLICGLALRLFFVTHFPFRAGDTKFYDELARNWLDHGVYGLFFYGDLMPTDMRVPGYPAFLAAVYALFHRSGTAVLIAQSLIDVVTCVFVAMLAARLAPPGTKERVATIALWTAALCPLTANYSSVFLTETLAMCLTTLALLVFLSVLEHRYVAGSAAAFGESLFSFVRHALLAGLLVGLGTLVRPDAPLLAVAAAVALAICLWRPRDWSKLALGVSWIALGVLLALMPWAIRNARTLGRAQFLAPRYAETNADFVPRGFYAWTGTWMVRATDTQILWKIGKAPITLKDLPDSAFDSPAERAEVAMLLDRSKAGLKMAPVPDHGFDLLARGRTKRHPLRTFIAIPVERAFVLWFAPRTGFLRIADDLFPLGEHWRENRGAFEIAALLAVLNIAYVGLAIAGAWRCRKNVGVQLLIIFIALRTAAMTQFQAVEARYVIVCFPALLAIGALGWPILQSSRSSIRESVSPSG